MYSYFEGNGLLERFSARVIRTLGLGEDRCAWLLAEDEGRAKAVLRASDDGIDVTWQVKSR